MMNCLEAQSKIVAFIEDKLSDDEELEFIRHIRSCDNCAEELEIYYTLLVGMKQLDEDKVLTTDFKTQMEEKLNAQYKHQQSPEDYAIFGCGHCCGSSGVYIFGV